MCQNYRMVLLGLGVCLSLMMRPVLAQGLYDADSGSVISSGSMGNSGIYTGMGASMSGGDMVVAGVKSQGAMSAGRDVSCSACQIMGNVAAGRNIKLEHSPQVGSIAAGQEVSLLDSHVLGSISAGYGVNLAQTTVQGNISTGHEADLQDSTVEGSVFQGGHNLKLNASSVQRDIYFRGGALQTVTSGSSVVSMIPANGLSTVRVSGQSLSRVNGYTIQGTPQQTTVITPQQAIYVNGRKVSGDGAKTYAEYRNAFPMAPVVEGPGWLDGGVSPAKHSFSRPSVPQDKAYSHPSVVNVLELTNNSLVNGQVVFESGYGKVLLHPGSRLIGQVVNGCVEKTAQ